MTTLSSPAGIYTTRWDTTNSDELRPHMGGSGPSWESQREFPEFRVRTGRFQVTVPVRIDLLQGRLMLGLRCVEQTGHGVRENVVVKRDSGVEILTAKVKLVWDDSRDVIVFEVADQDPWLKVRIDGIEGWIHTPEDFNAIGVPEPW